MTSNESGGVCLFLCGDVMTGRGIDQVLPHPGDPVLYEPCVRDARDYVRLAEAASGPLPHPMTVASIWGDALDELARVRPDVSIVNLETSVTRSPDAWPGKGIHYRMHPRNVGCITAARVDCCCLANNHVLDWGHSGLTETLQTLDAAGVARAGAGRNAVEAALPAVLGTAGKGRVCVYAIGDATSGIPRAWGATADRPGVNLLDDLSEDTARRIARHMRQDKRPGDVSLASIHWGPNWGYDLPDEQVSFAHRLIEGGVDVVHGHSSHHVKTIEVYRNRPILYGCGDFLNDYEGIGGHAAFRTDLTLMFLVTMDPADGGLVELRLVPMQIKRFRLNRASETDARWLCDRLNHLGASFGTRIRMNRDTSMTVLWQ